MKYVMIVLDGLGDVGKKTPLSKAKKPNIDFLARNGVTGLLDIGYKKEVNSDFGYLNLLGCYNKKDYPGRGYLEALGVYIFPQEGDVCIRGNFATLDKSGNLVDRRAGRDETGLDILAQILDGIEIDGVVFNVRKSAGHRVVVVMYGKNLSSELKPNDPLKTNVPVKQIIPKDPKNEKAKFTAHVLNKFLYKANKILSRNPINKKRKLPANTIIVRNFGEKKTTKSFERRFGLKAACVAGIPIAKGVAMFLGMNVIEVDGTTGMPKTNLSGKAKAVLDALKTHDFIFLHINGTDILSHDGKPEKKMRFIERIDKVVIGKLRENLDLKNTTIIITCDHRTASDPDFSGYRHLPDPVPVLVSGGGIHPDKIRRFDELSCEKGQIDMKAKELIPWILKAVKN
ncbi:MAG: phosphoglycerate mutase [Candidatus Aenigmatarchaeota archaeon]|nr:MAG: phosphoglycerate mutase [Candidatus Aenigmarchaeota archaeon]